MTAEYYRNVLLKNWRILLLCSFLLGTGAAVGSLLATPVYQSTVTIQLVMPYADAILLTTTSPVSLSFLTRVDLALQTEVDLATSDSIVEQVAGKHPGLTTAQLKSEITAQAIPNTRLFQITVSDREPARAAQLANDLAAVLISQQAQALQQANVQSQQELRASLAAIQSQIENDMAKISSLQSNPEANQQQLRALQKDVRSLQQESTLEQQTLAEVQAAEARTTSFLQVAEAAQANNTPVHAYQWLINTPAGLAFGVFLGIFLVLLRDRLDQRIRTVSALTELSGWPVLEKLRVPTREKGDAQGTSKQDDAERLAAYQRLTQNLDFLSIETPLRSLVVTSTPSESETANVVAADLALLLARSGKQVVLVDANFFLPSQHQRFGIPAKPGLGVAALELKALQGAERSLDPYLYRASDAFSLLRILPAGPIPPNPGQVVKSGVMKTIFQALDETGVEVVVVAGPPVAGSADVCALAALADGAIVVIERPRARKEKLVQMKRLLEEAGAKVLGCVVSSGPLIQPKHGERQAMPEGDPVV